MNETELKVTPIPVVYGNMGNYYTRIKRKTVRIQEPPGFMYVVEVDLDQYDPYTGKRLW